MSEKGKPLRIQLFNLPAPEDEHAFAVVLDQVPPDSLPRFQEVNWSGMCARVRCRDVLVFSETVEIVVPS